MSPSMHASSCSKFTRVERGKAFQSWSKIKGFVSETVSDVPMQYYRPVTWLVLPSQPIYPHTPRRIPVDTNGCLSHLRPLSTILLAYVHNCWQLCGVLSQVWIFRKWRCCGTTKMVTANEWRLLTCDDGDDVGVGACTTKNICHSQLCCCYMFSLYPIFWRGLATASPFIFSFWSERVIPVISP